MAKTGKTYDVFLTHAIGLDALSRRVSQHLREAGLAVFDIQDAKPGEALLKAIWEALAESHALVAVMSQSSAMSPSMAVEIGAASAWNKPIFLLKETQEEHLITSHFRECHVFTLAQIDSVIAQIREAQSRLSEANIIALMRAYSEAGIPTDAFARHPIELTRLTEKFRKETGLDVSGERILNELLRLRKLGQLPRMRRQYPQSAVQRRAEDKSAG
jgi:hypothetical protein